MTVLFGHPTGTPFSHHAALAHFEAGWLESICVRWMPATSTLRAISALGPLNKIAARLETRSFPPLDAATKSQARIGTLLKVLKQAFGSNVGMDGDNEWLMRRMTDELRNRGQVTIVHAYEDCAQHQFVEAKRLNKACVYDMPTCYFAEKERIDTELRNAYSDWVVEDKQAFVMHPEQKHAEMTMADLVLAPSKFVAESVRSAFPDKRIAIAPYGIDLCAWPKRPEIPLRDQLRFIYVGRCSLAKGVPLLIDAWHAAGLKNARLDLVGAWHLPEEKRWSLPPNCISRGRVSRQELAAAYWNADVFVLPTNYEGRATVVLEALASGLPVLATDVSGTDDAVGGAGRIVPRNDLDALVEGFRWFDAHRGEIPAMSLLARSRAEACTWEDYRGVVARAVRPFV